MAGRVLEVGGVPSEVLRVKLLVFRRYSRAHLVEASFAFLAIPARFSSWSVSYNVANMELSNLASDVSNLSDSLMARTNWIWNGSPVLSTSHNI